MVMAERSSDKMARPSQPVVSQVSGHVITLSPNVQSKHLVYYQPKKRTFILENTTLSICFQQDMSSLNVNAS